MAAKKKSEADWAVAILEKKQESMHYLDLLREIAKKMGKKPDNAMLTSMYTRLNLDNRLVYQGEGYWYYDANMMHRKE